MDSNKLRDKLFFRYLCSYLALVLIPLTVIGAFYSVSFSRTLKNEVLLNVDKDLQTIAAQLDKEISIMAGVVQQVSISSPMESLPDQFDPAAISSVQEALFAYCISNPFVEEVYATIPKLGYIISSSTSISIPYFTTRYYLSENLSPDGMAALFQSSVPRMTMAKELSRFARKPSDSVLFAYPLYTDYLQQLGTVVFEVSSSAVERLVNEKLGMYHAQTFIVSPQASLLCGYGAHADTAAAFSELSAVGGIGAVEKRFGREYIIREYVSGESGFAFITMIPRDQQVFTQLTHMNYLFLTAVAVVAVISGLAIVKVLRVQYFPLRRLHDTAERLMNKNGTLNMISDIEDALNALNGQNTSLITSFQKNELSIKNDRLHTLLSGGYATAEDFNLDCQELNMHLGGELLFITITRIHAEQVSADEIGQRMKTALSDLSDSYYLTTLESGKLIMVHSASAQAYEKLPRLLAGVHGELLKERGILLTTGIGSALCEARALARSYMDAESALEYRFVKGVGGVILYGETGGDSGRFVYPLQQFDKLKNALLSESEDNVSRCIDETVAIIQKNKYPLAMAKGMCFTLIYMATNAPGTGMARFAPGGTARFEAGERETLQDIADAIKEWRDQRRIPAPPKEDHAECSVEKVVCYLKEHCLNCDFSINETAEHFGMQLPKLSQYFKDQTGQNILDYSIQLRMDEAARLLDDTSLGLKEIALKTGYYNTSSFIRRFKQTKGITPGEYRKVSRV